MKTDMSVKQWVKQYPGIVSIVRYIRNEYLLLKKQYFNRTYKRNIEKLYNRQVFERKLLTIQKRIKNGKDIPFYIIATENSQLGILGFVNCFLPHIAYAIAKGYVPVIDMKNYKSIYQVSDENVWEKFFEQPLSVSLSAIKGKVIRCPVDFYYSGMPRCTPMMDNHEIRLWALVFKMLVRANEQTRAYLDQELSQLLKSPSQTIGVIYRGTDYTQGHANGHPIQPTKKMIVDSIDTLRADGSFKYIYVASDEYSIVKYLEEKYPDAVIINKRVFYDLESQIDYSKYNEDHRGISEVRFCRPNDDFFRGVEYLSSINLVSKCAALVAGGCGGTIAALYMNDSHFREIQVYQLGRYGFDPIPNDI